MNYKLMIVIFGLVLNLFVSAQQPLAIFIDTRDCNQYEIVQLNDLKWFAENLRYQSVSKKDTLIPIDNCGIFYLQEDAKVACPDGWRLPTEKEVNSLVRLNKKGELNLIDTLNIGLCGRIDYERHSKFGQQNTFWLNDDLKNGNVVHWHTFGNEIKIHSHNVINARRKFPVRCVCEID
jgi:hypothetical protein